MEVPWVAIFSQTTVIFPSYPQWWPPFQNWGLHYGRGSPPVESFLSSSPHGGLFSQATLEGNALNSSLPVLLGTLWTPSDLCTQQSCRASNSPMLGPPMGGWRGVGLMHGQQNGGQGSSQLAQRVR